MTQIINKALHFFFLSCQEATFLIEKKLHNCLSFKEKIQLKGHLLFCKWCDVYRKKTDFLHQFLKHYLKNEKDENITQHTDIESFKEKLKKKIRQG